MRWLVSFLKTTLKATLKNATIAFVFLPAVVFGVTSPVADPYRTFEHPSKMVALGQRTTLAMYCSGKGSPLVILETGSGGGTYATWYKLQPLIASRTRVCSYDRAGFGFSLLGNDLPRDLDHDLGDLHELLIAMHERGPYILVGHSMGGELTGAYVDRYPDEIGGLVLLEASVLLAKEEAGANSPKETLQLENSLKKYSVCESRMRSHESSQPAPHDECLDSTYFASLPPAMAAVEIKHESTPEYWRALKSELENNWLDDDSREAAALMPHRWGHATVRVVSAAVSEVSDQELASQLGVSVSDTAALESVRQNHKRWEQRQARVCEFSTDCKVTVIPTADHFVQNAAPERVAAIIAEVVELVRESDKKR